MTKVQELLESEWVRELRQDGESKVRELMYVYTLLSLHVAGLCAGSNPRYNSDDLKELSEIFEAKICQAVLNA